MCYIFIPIPVNIFLKKGQIHFQTYDSPLASAYSSIIFVVFKTSLIKKNNRKPFGRSSTCCGSQHFLGLTNIAKTSHHLKGKTIPLQSWTLCWPAGGWGSQNFWTIGTWRLQGYQSCAPTACGSHGLHLVLIAVRRWAEPRATVRPEELSK